VKSLYILSVSSLLSELCAWATSASEVEFDDTIRARLGPSVSVGEENARYMRAYVFTYTSLGKNIAGYIVVPKSAQSIPLPVIIFNRGGTKDFGSIKPGMLFKHIADIARWGYLVVGSQYPGNSLSGGHDEWGGDDVQSILDLYPLIQHLSIADEQRIGMFGESRGGMMTYLSLSQASWIRAAVTLAGAANLVRGAALRPEMQAVYTEAFGGDEEGKKQRSAIFWPEKFPDNVPLLLLHGTADWRVSPLDSIDLAAKLYEHKKPFQLIVYDGGDHGLSQFRNGWLDQTKLWFNRHLEQKDREQSLA